MNSEVYIFIVLFLSIFSVIITHLYLNYKKEAERQTTIRLAVDKGQQLTPDVVDSLVPKKLRMTGLHIGMPFVGIGLAFFLFGFGINEPNVSWGAVFPLFFGLGFIASWYISRKVM